MYLQQLTLHNYRRFADLSVDFDRRLTVLVGANGTGKTAIIDAAAIMLGTFLAKFPDVSGPAIQRSDARRRHFDVGGVRDTQQQFPVTLGASGIIAEPTPWDRVRADRGEAGRQNASAAPTQPTQPTQWSRQWSRSLRGLNGKMTSGEAHDLIELSDRYQSAVRTDPTIVLPVIAYYGTDRLWPRDRAQWKTHSDAYLEAGTRFGGYDGCLNSSVSYKQMATWFKKMTSEQLRRGTGIPAFQAARATVSECLRAMTGHEGARIDYADGGLLVSYTAPDGTVVDDAPFETLSDGYRVIIGVVTDLARRMAMLNPVMGADAVAQTPGVALIDEVDLHLHPLWQSQILGMLTDLFPNVQFIVTTHAPIVIASAHRSNVRILHYDAADGAARASVPGFETFGQPASHTVQAVQGAHDLPANVRNAIADFEQAVDADDYPAATKRLDALRALIGEDNPEFVTAQTSYSFMDPSDGADDNGADDAEGGEA